MFKLYVPTRKILILLALAAICFYVWQVLKPVPKNGNWRDELSRQSTAEFDGNKVTVRNVRNFRYSQDENNNTAGYYDQAYDLDKILKIWYVVDPFKEQQYAAHTFLSFEFSDGKFISITIEARKEKGQDYSLLSGLFNTYPLMYIAADERDAILLRANVRKDEIYLYPVKATPQQARLLFVDILEKMNSLSEQPEWYNTFTANCTSSIAYHINKIWKGRLPKFSWQLWVTGYAEKMAFEQGLIDTSLSLPEARKKYYATGLSQKAGDAVDYSPKIRDFAD